MAGLQGRVKNALDEARMLVLGAQVLLGFQYRGFFEKAYDQLSPAERALKMAALFALLATIGALFLIAGRHRIVEQGRDSARFHRFTRAVMQVVLLPFALALWYGPFALRGRRIAEKEEDAMEDTPLEHRIVEVLTEARVLLPGAQALLGFQLAIVLMETFAKLPRDAQLVHLASLGFVTLATIVLMAPAAYHRIVERGRDTERFHGFASRMLLLALALLGPGFSGDLYVVLQRAGFARAALPVAAATLLVFYGAWFGAMFLLRRRRAPALRDRTA